MREIRIIMLLLALMFTLAEIGEAEQRDPILVGRIVSVNQEHGFAIISLGAEDGIKEGMLLAIYRNDEMIGEAEVINVKQNIAGVDIEEVVETEVDDVVLIKEKGAGRTAETRPQIPPPPYPVEKMEKAEPIHVKAEPVGGPVTTEINANSEAVFFLLTQALREYRFIITGSQKNEGLLTAKKDIELSLVKEIWADLIGTTDHELLLSVKIAPQGPAVTRLSMHLDATYKQNGEHKRVLVNKGSPLYKEAEEMARKIKQRAE